MRHPASIMPYGADHRNTPLALNPNECGGGNPETWAVGFLDECWWSRLALPTSSSFSEEGKPLPQSEVGR